MVSTVLASAGHWELRKAPGYGLDDVEHPSVAITSIANALNTPVERPPTSLSLEGAVPETLGGRSHPLPTCLVSSPLSALDKVWG